MEGKHILAGVIGLGLVGMAVKAVKTIKKRREDLNDQPIIIDMEDEDNE